MSRQTTSGARIGDPVVLFCSHSIPMRSHEKAVPYAKREFFLIHKIWCGFLHPSATQGLSVTPQRQEKEDAYSTIIAAHTNKLHIQ